METINDNMSSTLPKINLSGGAGGGGSENNILKNNVPKLNPESDKKLNNTISNFSKKSEIGGLNTDTRTSLFQGMGALIMNSIPFQVNSVIIKKENVNNFSSKVPNLKLAIEQLDLIPENEEKEEDENKINNTNLFKNFKIDKIGNNNKENKLDDINTFNNTIMSAKNWGENNLKNNNNKDPMERTNYFKPNKKNQERELGRSIVDTKLPRARLPNRFMEQQIISKSTNLNLKKSDINEINI